MREPLPVSGAWRPGDPPGRRQFLSIATDRPFSLEGGGQLRDITLAYETWGQLDATGSNAILVCHAWTGDSHVIGSMSAGHPTPRRMTRTVALPGLVPRTPASRPVLSNCSN